MIVRNSAQGDTWLQERLGKVDYLDPQEEETNYWGAADGLRPYPLGLCGTGLMRVTGTRNNAATHGVSRALGRLPRGWCYLSWSHV